MLACRCRSEFHAGELLKDLAVKIRLLLYPNVPIELTFDVLVLLEKIILRRQPRCLLELDSSKPPQIHGFVLCSMAVFDPPHIRERGVFVIPGGMIGCAWAPRPFGIGDQDQIA